MMKIRLHTLINNRYNIIQDYNMKTFMQFLEESESVQGIHLSKNQETIANKITDGDWGQYKYTPEAQNAVVVSKNGAWVKLKYDP